MFEQYTVSELRVLLQKKEISSLELTRDYLSRIEADKTSHAYLTVTAEQAILQAKEVDRKRMAKEKLTFVSGIPIAIKDNFCTAGIPTTCGSKMLEHFIPPYDATVAARLKQAGMVILGKTNLDEFGMGSTGENSAFAVSTFYHPGDRKRYLPGGSSSGSAVAVKEQLAPIAVGSDTGGSVRQPAALCGLCGYKPPYGASSRSGLVSFAPSMDTPGVIAKSVRDIGYLCSYIIHEDAADSTSKYYRSSFLFQNAHFSKDAYRAALPKQYLYAEGVLPQVRDAILLAADRLRQSGWTVDEVSMPMTEAALPAYYVIACAEAASNLARFDGVRYGHRTETFADIRELIARSRSEGFGEEVKRRIMMGNYVLSAEYYDAYYRKAMQVREAVKEEFSMILNQYHMILTPAAPFTAKVITERKLAPTEMYAADLCTVPASLAGLPALTLPLPQGEKLPIGVQLIAQPGDFGTLLTYGQTLQRIVCSEKGGRTDD